MPYKQDPKTITKVKEIEVEKIVEIPYEVSVSDRVREAHEYLFGFGRPQRIKEALKTYHIEADKNNENAYNSLGQIYLEGKFFPMDLNLVKLLLKFFF